MEPKHGAFEPRADAIDGTTFVETAGTLAASTALWGLLRIARRSPPTGLPVVVLCGPHGSGTSTVARRFCRAAWRHSACEVIAGKIGGPLDEPPPGRGTAWDEDMALRHGMTLDRMTLDRAALDGRVSADDLVSWTALSSTGQPALLSEMAVRPDRDAAWLKSKIWYATHNALSHPTRRTSVAVIDQADRFLAVPQSRRHECLDRIDHHLATAVQHAVVPVFVGSPGLATAIADCRTTHVISLNAMGDGADFAVVVDLIFGTRDPVEVSALHRASGGLVGKLFHIARMGGIEPEVREVDPDLDLDLPPALFGPPSPTSGASGGSD